MFTLENNLLTDSNTGKSFETFSILFDLKAKRIICHGSTKIIDRKQHDIASNPLSDTLPKAVAFNPPTQKDVDDINMMMSVDGYPAIWLRNNSYCD